MYEFGIRIGKVVKVNYGVNTVDVLLDSGFGVIRDVPVVSNVASTNTAYFELPVLKTVDGVTPGNVVSASDGSQTPIKDLYRLENLVAGKINLDDPTTNYVYAVVIGANEQYGKSNPVCIGFLYPYRNQVLFDPDNVDSSLPQPTQDAIKKLKGGSLHRSNSGVYTVLDSDGNYEWAHPNGSFFRIAETPTLPTDGAIHVDYSKGNKRAKTTKNEDTNIVWDVTQQIGNDGNLNKDRKVYAHLEIITAKGTVVLDIDKDTGNITIKTPGDSSQSNGASNNQLTIICGGNVTLESVQGDVAIQAIDGQVKIEASNQITQTTDSAASGSILMGANGANGADHLVLLTKLEQKFNSHQHICTGSNHNTTGPTTYIDNSDGTTVTVAG